MEKSLSVLSVKSVVLPFGCAALRNVGASRIDDPRKLQRESAHF
jgi:hypothetical protein